MELKHDFWATCSDGGKSGCDHINLGSRERVCDVARSSSAESRAVCDSRWDRRRNSCRSLDFMSGWTLNTSGIRRTVLVTIFTVVDWPMYVAVDVAVARTVAVDVVVALTVLTTVDTAVCPAC
jgi:hypothetical protein